MLIRLATLTVSGALAVSFAAPVVAAGLVPVDPEPIIAPVPMTPPDTDWTGFYAGAQIGWGFVNGDGEFDTGTIADLDIDVDGDGAVGGLTAGYRWDFGQFVAGGEVQYDWADIDFDDVNVGALDIQLDDVGRVDQIWRVKGIAGYDAGRTLIYGSVGWANASVEVNGEDGDENGWLVGAGVDYLLTDRLTLGGEVMYHQFDDFGSDGENFDVDLTTVHAKLTYRF